ncbi:MAG: hypothetical protein M3R44_07925, partial [Candidatus Eremiobacteraeota bacterium]|nr:hypothetical protein [Candidatus Eremiobacteraeota bacterium]
MILAIVAGVLPDAWIGVAVAAGADVGFGMRAAANVAFAERAGAGVTCGVRAGDGVGFGVRVGAGVCVGVASVMRTGAGIFVAAAGRAAGVPVGSGVAVGANAMRPRFWATVRAAPGLGLGAGSKRHGANVQGFDGVEAARVAPPARAPPEATSGDGTGVA